MKKYYHCANHDEYNFYHEFHMGHAATKPDKVNIGITKDFRDQNLVT